MYLPAGRRGKKDPSRCKHVGRIYPQPDVKGQKYEYLQGGGGRGRGGGRGTRACRSLVKVQWPRGNRSHSREFRMNVSEILHLTTRHKNKDQFTRARHPSSSLALGQPPSPRVPARVPRTPTRHSSLCRCKSRRESSPTTGEYISCTPPPAPARPPSGPRPCTSS